jgi:SAM-dependent methyltransferase
MSDLDHAAQRGEPSHVWRAGQQRRMSIIRTAAGDRIYGRVLDDGCGVGQYLNKLAVYSNQAVGLEYDPEFATQARLRAEDVVRGAGESLPFSNSSFDLVLSHEVLEHVQDDKSALAEITRVLRSPDPSGGHTGGRLVLFVPNRGYPFETHGFYWHGRYRFGNIPLINYLPRRLRNRLAPHVRVYTRADLERLFAGLPVKILERKIIFGAYDNIIARWPRVGHAIRALLQALENTPLHFLGLSHVWVVEKK